jgi:hypothetical protein
MEYIPLALALLVLLKVEATLYDGERDNQIYRRKLAEHLDRVACGKCLGQVEPICREAQNNREACQAADGDVRRKTP